LLEAQIAGLPDQNKFTPLMNPILKLVKAMSYENVRKRRQEVFNWIREAKIDIDFFNGGGTGSIELAVTEPWLTEVPLFPR